MGFERNPLNYKANALLLCCSHRPVAKELADSKVKLSSYAILNNWNWFEVNLSSSKFCRRCRQVKSGQLKIKLRGQSESYTLSVSPSLSLSLSLSNTHTLSLLFTLLFSLCDSIKSKMVFSRLWCNFQFVSMEHSIDLSWSCSSVVELRLSDRGVVESIPGRFCWIHQFPLHHWINIAPGQCLDGRPLGHSWCC